MNKEDSLMHRRKLLVLAGTSAAALMGGASYALSGTGKSPDKQTNSAPEKPSDTPRKGSNSTGTDGVSIAEFGATAGTDSKAVARQNREAIRDAALAAGEGGTVRVPAGEYYFGDTTLLNQLRFGRSEPSGISFVGEGPRRSKLIFTATVKPNSGYRGFRYDGTDQQGNPIDHGEVTIRNLCFDGNYENLNINPGRTIWGFNIHGNGSFNFENVWIRGWWANATRFQDVSVEMRRCLFQENAIGVAQVSSERTAGHHISANPSGNDSVLIEDCRFERCSGTVLNRRRGDGDVVMRRVLVRGVGYGCIKLSDTNGTTRVQDVNFVPQTDWLLENLPQRYEMDGRWFVYRVRGDEYTPTIDIQDVVAGRLSRSFILCFGDTELVVSGNRIAVRHASLDDKHDPAAIRADSRIKFDIDTISVHDTGDKVFDTPEAVGTIGTLYRDGNEGLGDPGNTSLGDRPNSKTIKPDVVTPDEVGLDF